ncbi:Na+/H+ antiporter subunit E [Halovenus rubra]|uniref:Na+/H+ antiporter subunit E n=2 Tax=Halovenus rubra TaxID=869890 RepID=A0ACC7E4A8_9EURY
MKTHRWVVAGLLFATIWLFVNGPALSLQSFVTTYLIGLVVGLPLAFVFRRLYKETITIERSLTAIPYIVLYVFVFSKEVLRANIDVAYRVLMPGLPLEPQVILVPLRVESDLGVTTIANSITITPGTITLDHDPDRNALYVHAIDGRHPQELVEPIRQWEDYALVIFDEERTPDDPAPEITVHPPDHPPEPKTLGEGNQQHSDSQEEIDG